MEQAVQSLTTTLERVCPPTSFLLKGQARKQEAWPPIKPNRLRTWAELIPTKGPISLCNTSPNALMFYVYKKAILSWIDFMNI